METWVEEEGRSDEVKTRSTLLLIRVRSRLLIQEMSSVPTDAGIVRMNLAMAGCSQ